MKRGPQGDRLEKDLTTLVEEAETPKEKFAAQICFRLFGLIKMQQVQINLLARTPLEEPSRLLATLEE